MVSVLKLIQDGGAAVAVVFVTIVFLRHLGSYQELLKQIAAQFTAEINTLQAGFQAQINTVTQTQNAVNEQTINALNTLNESVRAVQEGIIGIQREGCSKATICRIPPEK